jgi:hypothetical protein
MFFKYLQFKIVDLRSLTTRCLNTGIRLREGFDDLDIMKETHYQPDVNYDYIKSPGFSTSLPLFPTKLPHHKAVVIVKLNNLKTSYGVRISWSAVH